MSAKERARRTPSAEVKGTGAALTPFSAALVLALSVAFTSLSANLLFHPIPLYGTETDLLGEYIPAAQELSHGLMRPEHFTTKGPGYPLLLTLFAPLTQDWFLTARVINSLAAGFVVGSAFLFFGTLLGEWVGLAVCVGLIVNPIFLLACIEAGTDLPALAFALGSSCLAFISTGRQRAFWAGFLAGYAGICRSNLVSVPVASLIVLLLHPQWRRSWGPYFIGALLPISAWLGVFFAATGKLPQDSNYLNVAYAIYGAGQGWDDFLTLAAPRFHSYSDVFLASPQRVITGLISQFGTRWWLDATRLATFPLGVVCFVGVAWCWRRYSAWAILTAHLAVAYFILCFSFYSPRFDLYLLPFLLSGAALLLLPMRRSEPSGRTDRRRWRLLTGGGALAVLYLVSAVTALTQVRTALAGAPYAARAIGEALRPLASPEDVVMARKPHVAYYAGLRYMPMPRTTSLTDLIVEANRRGAAFIFVSPIERALRPEYTVLTDSGQALPGLRQIAYYGGRQGPAAAYEVGSPLPDEVSQRHAVAASLERGPFSASREGQVAIATELLGARDYEQALYHLLAADSAGPPDADIAALECDAYHALQRYDEAANACLRSMRLGGATAAHFDQLGRIRFQQGRYDEASRNFTQAIHMAPGVAAPIYLLGLSKYRLGNYGEAAVQFLSYLVSHPRSVESRRLAAVSLARSGRTGEALRILQDNRGAGPDGTGPTLADSLKQGLFPE